MKIFVFGIGESVKNIFNKQNIFLLLVGFIFTFICVVSGFDWNYYLYFNSLAINKYLFPAIALGGLIPVFFPIILFIYAKLKKSKKLLLWSGLLGQSAFMGWFTSSVIKAFTGRIQPNSHDLVNNISGGFNFGFLQHGVFWGWPSSHTATIFSLVTAVVVVLLSNKLNYKKKILAFILILFAFYVGISVSMTIHWFSDFLMGAILGFVVGREIGKTFKKVLI